MPVRVGVVAHRGDARERACRSPRRGRAPCARRRAARGRRRRRPAGMPSARAKSLPRPPGSDAERGGAAQRAGERADEPVAAERDDHLAAPGRVAGRVRGVRQVARLDDAVLGARPRPAPSAPRAAGAAACRPRTWGSSGSRTCGRRSRAPRKVVRPGAGRPRRDRLEAVALETLPQPAGRGVEGRRRSARGDVDHVPAGAQQRETGAKNGGMFSIITRS